MKTVDMNSWFLRHGRAKRTGTAAPCAHRTLDVSHAARLPRCRRRGACADVVGTFALIANRRFGMLLADRTDHPDEGLVRERSTARSVRSTRSGSPTRAALTSGRRSVDVRRAAVGRVLGLSCMERTSARDASRNWRQAMYAAGINSADQPPMRTGASKNSVLHRDLDIPSIAKYVKDASERFVSISESHSNPLLSTAVSYEAPPPYHFIRRPRNVITDPPDDFTADVESYIKINKQNDN
ncbi:hypothetical protein EVAR_33248_1 [Eumeta japonica]|uniref:Uncharacterized protein n=1 Tax=Eumeta variegata TaxID=151549 RepID=A0A4C1X2V7_EUMVA|nr:hypothetical protein EVAR_33248_1 [Eumeta japonica]